MFPTTTAGPSAKASGAVARLRIEGAGMAEICHIVGLSPATVGRILVVVRKVLAEVFEVKGED